jgi:hypothetical protein
MYTDIACVAAPRICPPGARAKMPINSCASPKGAIDKKERPTMNKHNKINETSKTAKKAVFQYSREM